MEFCNKVRTLTGDEGPFGRMCVWKLQPNKQLLPHVDAFKYHFSIIRNIFIISENPNNLLQVIIDEKPIPVDKGMLFQFDPAREWHSFINDSNEVFYFLGFDFWLKDHIDNFQKTIDIDAVIRNPARLAKFGGRDTESKYISKH